MNEQNLALNPFKKGKKGEIEGVREVGVEGDSKLMNLFDHYKNHEGEHTYEDLFDAPILKPEEITRFSDYIILGNHLNKNEFRDSESGTFGDMITQLIRISYKLGNNDFVFNSHSVDKVLEDRINYVGYDLHGKNDDPIRLKINGDVGNYCGANSQYLDLIVNGNVEAFAGERSKDSRYLIRGHVESGCGLIAQDCYFDIERDVEGSIGGGAKGCIFYLNNLNNSDGDSMSDSINSHYHIRGNLDCFEGYGAQNCSITIHGDIREKGDAGETKNIIYKASNQYMYEILCKWLDETNAVYLIDKTGKVLERRK